ncbi:MAG: hypothetical protein LUI05_05855 [Oscillospiraceae bacterium]|nr:hypothetical protein [Oscillospiraceae bacterium]
MKEWKSILTAIKSNENMMKQWNTYSNTYEYAKGITLEQICDSVNDNFVELSR